jgi:hypothetical protein
MRARAPSSVDCAIGSSAIPAIRQSYRECRDANATHGRIHAIEAARNTDRVERCQATAARILPISGKADQPP